MELVFNYHNPGQEYTNILLLAVDPAESCNIFNRESEYLLSRNKPKFKNYTKALIYSRYPDNAFTGFIKLGACSCGTRGEVFRETKSHIALSFDQYFDYFDGCSQAFCTYISEIMPFSKPIYAKELFGNMKINCRTQYLPPEFTNIINEQTINYILPCLIN